MIKTLYDNSGRKEWVDLGKGISILLVVMFHCEVLLGIVETGTEQIFSFFRMPFFFFLSGYVFVSDYRQFSLKRKLKQILRGIVWTYLVFSLIMVVPKALSNGFSVMEGVKDVFLGWGSWFVVALGVGQLLFALFLSFFKKTWEIVLFIFCCMIAGIAIKCHTGEILPYQFEKALFVVLFLGMGFFYRIHEERISGIFCKKYLAIGIFAYVALMVVESELFHGTTSNIFWNNRIDNFPLFLLYTFSGIFMMLQIVKNIDASKMKLICYIGYNSLIFYYLNGGVVKCWKVVYNRFSDSVLLQNDWLVFLLVFLLVCLTLFVASYFIKKYCPLLVGDKKAFNRYLPKYNW